MTKEQERLEKYYSEMDAALPEMLRFSSTLLNLVREHFHGDADKALFCLQACACIMAGKASHWTHTRFTEFVSGVYEMVQDRKDIQ